ncbi:MAG: hypothetical protein Q8R32_01145, partial [bacterium]|nr:hypothetical protein [bacterium]
GLGLPTPVTRVLPSSSPSPNAVLDVRPRGPLREAKHAERLERVVGHIRGMTNKLTNLSSNLDKHLANIERRIVALRAAGHEITVEEELTVVRTATKALQEKIASAVRELDALADNEKPRVVSATVRRLIRDIRADLRTVRAAFQKLRLAIRADVKAKPSPSPIATSVSPLPATGTLSSPSTGFVPVSPLPSPTTTL